MVTSPLNTDKNQKIDKYLTFLAINHGLPQEKTDGSRYHGA
jgi:hypothetical protein